MFVNKLYAHLRHGFGMFVIKYTWCLTSTETVRLIRDGEKGGRGYGGGGRGRLLCLSLHCHHQNDSCIKMGSDESHLTS